MAGSAYAGATELAEGIVFPRERLVVQACRRSGPDRTARLSISYVKVDGDPVGAVSLVRIETPTLAAKSAVTSLGLDLTESGGPGYVDALVHDGDELRKLTAAGLAYTTLVPDLRALDRRERRTDVRYARRVARSSLPSGRDTYRRLFDYSEEMKRLARQNPQLVRRIRLPFKTWEGRPVEGIEIASQVHSQSDGRPVFLLMGLHHAREWPSGDQAMEWAYELIRGYKAQRAPFRNLVTRTRTIAIPVVNPDGFNTSREAGQLQGAAAGRGGDATQEVVNAVTYPYEYKRKNCRFSDDRPAGDCGQPSNPASEPGVDPNRNYGGFWGGPGASDDPLADDYRGPGPFSEPETRNIRWLVSRRQVTTLLSLHTDGDLVIRPPGVQTNGYTLDEPLYKRLGGAMAAENGYENMPGWRLYDTSGTTEDWSYYTTGGLAFTFEIGPLNFHPPFAEMVAEYEGTTERAGKGGGNRAAFLIAQRNTADPMRHSVLAGSAPPGSSLRLDKSFRTPTATGTRFRDHLTSRLKVPASGRFNWQINPSTRPLVGKTTGRKAHGRPSPPQTFSGAPGPSAHTCVGGEDESCFNDHPFVVPRGPGIDNAKATVRIEWATSGSDWDLQVFRDTNGDGSSVGETHPVASSLGSGTNFEEATFVEPILKPGVKYVARVTNFAADQPYQGRITFAGPDPIVKAKHERWTLTCWLGGKRRDARRIFLKRGQRLRLDLREACRD